MNTLNKCIIFIIVVGCFLFARNVRENIRIEKRSNSEYYWVKDYSDNKDENQLNRKRSHKRRRKITKPVKGLR